MAARVLNAPDQSLNVKVGLTALSYNKNIVAYSEQYNFVSVSVRQSSLGVFICDFFHFNFL